jgi:hypothetical protein
MAGGVYRKNRKIALQLSDGFCVKCGREADHVHHVYGTSDNRVEHLRPLCRWCHTVAHRHGDYSDLYWEWERTGESGPEWFIAGAIAEVQESRAEFHEVEFELHVREIAAPMLAMLTGIDATLIGDRILSNTAREK